MEPVTIKQALEEKRLLENHLSDVLQKIQVDFENKYDCKTIVSLSYTEQQTYGGIVRQHKFEIAIL